MKRSCQFATFFSGQSTTLALQHCNGAWTLNVSKFIRIKYGNNNNNRSWKCRRTKMQEKGSKPWCFQQASNDKLSALPPKFLTKSVL